MRLACFDTDLAHGQQWISPLAAPGDDGLHLVPHVLPQGRSLPVQFEHHQIPQVLVQGDQEGVRLIAGDLLRAGGEMFETEWSC